MSHRYEDDNTSECSHDTNDTPGSLVDFIVDDDSNTMDMQSSDEESENEVTVAQNLVDEFPFDRALLETSGRPRRNRRQVDRYRDSCFEQLMLGSDEEDVDVDGSDEEENQEDEDEDFVVDDESSDEESSSDDE